MGACWTLKFAKFLDVVGDDLGQHPPKPKKTSAETSLPLRMFFFSERRTPNQIWWLETLGVVDVFSYCNVRCNVCCFRIFRGFIGKVVIGSRRGAPYITRRFLNRSIGRRQLVKCASTEVRECLLKTTYIEPILPKKHHGTKNNPLKRRIIIQTHQKPHQNTQRSQISFCFNISHPISPCVFCLPGTLVKALWSWFGWQRGGRSFTRKPGR